MRGVAPAAAARSMAGVELFLLLELSRSRFVGVGVYAVRKADPKESFDRALLLLGSFEERNMLDEGLRLLACKRARPAGVKDADLSKGLA